METLNDRDLQLKREETIQKLKDYINSLVTKKFKKTTKKILDNTNEKIIDILDQDEQDFEEEQEETQQDNLAEDEQKQDFDIPSEDQDEYIPRDSEF